MRPVYILSLIGILALTTPILAEAENGKDSDLPVPGESEGQTEATLDVAVKIGSWQLSRTKQDTWDLNSKFQKMADPPLKLGDTGDRVRELQATLNMELGDKKITLRQPIGVGPAKGTGSTLKGKQRLGYSKRRDLAFQIPGDWEPVDESGESIWKDFTDDADVPADQLRQVSIFLLPEEPLKVDGIYGQHTQTGVALFQHQQGLPVTGEVDAVTLDKLEPLLPTNPILAFILSQVREPFDKEDDNYPFLVKTMSSVLAALLILIGAAVVYQLCRSLANSTQFLSRWLFTPESSPWFTAMRENKVFLRGAQFGPALFIYFSGQVIFPAPDQTEDIFPYLNTFQDWNLIVSHVGLAYLSLVGILFGFAGANAVDKMVNPDPTTQNAIGSIVRASKRLMGFLGTLLILASLAGESPFIIMGGLGAFMAIFVLVFRDYLLGLVSSVQIISHKVVRVGDWVTMPKYNADGDVTKISLTLLKVQNFDKTISTIPTSSVLSDSFRNWTGMQRSGGRRMKRVILIDLRSIQVCSPEMIVKFQRMELLGDYIDFKQDELERYNQEHDGEASPVNSRRLTNIGTFRAYLDQYLRNHPGLNKEMTILVRHLQPTTSGLPLEIYAFCEDTDWAKYEAVQADIFDHLLAVLPEFGLRPFQHLSESEQKRVPADEKHLRLQAGLAELESMVNVANRELVQNPRTQPASRVLRIAKQIGKLGLTEHFNVEGKGRKIVLRHLREE